MPRPKGVLDSIGHTPIVPLRRIVPKGSARILVKLEWTNPTGSTEDRMARAVIRAAAEDGRLPKGRTVVEYTAGTAPPGSPIRAKSFPSRAARVGDYAR